MLFKARARVALLVSTRDSKQSIIHNFFSDKFGGIAVMAGFLITLGFLGVATAYEITSAVAAKRILNRSADAAVLAGTRAAVRAFEDGHTDWAGEGQQVAENFWNSASERITDADISFANFEFTRDALAMTGTVEYSANHSSLFANFVPRAARIGDKVTAQIQLKTYVDLTFLVDVSASMGIGATTADQDLMFSNNGCAFACHIPKTDGQRNKTPDAARMVGAKLRMDVVREALIDSIELLRGRVGPDEVQVSVYSFDTTYQEIVAPTTDLDAVKTDMADLEMVSYSPTGPQRIGSTLVSNALDELHGTLQARGNHGDGFDPSQRKSYVVLIGDGLESSVWLERTGTFPDGADQFSEGATLPDGWTTQSDALNYGGTKFLQSFDSGSCTPLKRDGHTLLGAQILYITTPDMRTTASLINQVDYIESKENDIHSAFSSCVTSPSFHNTANTPAEISILFDGVVDAVLTSKLRLTN